MAMRLLQILISGQVQGVGYRYFAQGAAESLKIGGWVRNLKDGRVEVLVACEEETCKNFLSRLEEGPPKSKVEDLNYKILNQAFAWKEFVIKEDGEFPWLQEK